VSSRISTITSIDEPAKRDALRLLVTQIANAIDDTTVSYIAFSVDEAAKNAGISSSVTDL
jgi:hypothetical protein